MTTPFRRQTPPHLPPQRLHAGPTSQYLPAIRAMNATPGVWYLIREYVPSDPSGHLWTPETARNLAQRIRSGRPQCFGPKGTFDATSDTTPEGVHRVFARLRTEE